jgi:ABC-type uncharacterized transport system substrate-binding protein
VSLNCHINTQVLRNTFHVTIEDTIEQGSEDNSTTASEQVSEVSKKLCNEELNNLFSKKYFRKIRQAGHEACMKMHQEIRKRKVKKKNFRRVLYVVRFLLADSPASEFYKPTFRNTLSVPSS